jgi:hypothetical protein
MASRSSGNFNSEFYVGTRRGRFDGGDIGFEMFPEKYEQTLMYEDPEQLNEDRRETLKDFSPDSSRMFAYEEPRRTTYAHDALNLRDGGARTTTDPWANDDFDQSFHDKDPRGWSTEQPWREYRRHLEAQLRMTDFKDDGDYSTTSGHIHPNTLYRSIRSAQDWVKARLKIFETSLTNNHNGGVGIYPNISNVFKSEYEDQSIMMDGSMNQTFEDPENRSRAAMRLSNMVHGGSKALRANTTTDHKVLVAAYGKLMRQRGLINHENQLRLLEDDTNWSKIEGMSGGAPRNAIQVMSSLANGESAATTGRLLAQDQQSPGTSERFRGIRYDETELTTRNFTITKDIMSLLGITENELKLLESKSSSNDKHAVHALANLYEMAEAVHRLPAHTKLEIRDELLLKSAGAGMVPGTGYVARANVIINPKILSFMSTQVRTSRPKDIDQAWWNADGDSEGKLDRALSKAPLLVYRTQSNDGDNISSLWTDSDHVKPGSKRAHSYKNLVMTATRIQENRNKSGVGNWFDDAGRFNYGKLKTHAGEDNAVAMQHAEIDNEFGENHALTRHIGPMGSKKTRHLLRRDDSPRTDMELEAGSRRNLHR